MNVYYKTVALTIACFVAAFMTWWEFFEFSLNEIKSSRMILNSQGIGMFLNSGKLLFAISVGLIPLLHSGVTKFANVRSTQQKLITLGAIVSCGIATWQARLLRVKLGSYRTNSIIESTGDDIHFEYQITQLQPELYLASGLLIGAIASVLIFTTLNRKTGE